MIEERTFLQVAIEAKTAITNGRLNDALLLLRTLTNSVGNNRLSDARETIDTDYSHLLQFMQEGGEDDTRTEQYLRLLQKAASLLQDTRRLHRLDRLNDIYSHTWSQLPRHWEDGVDNAMATVESGLTPNAADTAFNLIWTSPQFTAEASEIMLNFLYRNQRENTPYYICALTLSLLEYFDAKKIDILLACCQSSDAQLRSRALVGACVASQLHSGYIMLHPDLCHKYYTLNLNEEVFIIQHVFCLYQETDNVQNKIQQHMNGMKQNKQMNTDMKMVMEMFRDGIDLNLNTLGTMKRFPFFKEPCHWFLPFKTDGQNSIDIFLDRLSLCDSDKRSLSLILETMPTEQRKKMMQQMSEALPDFTEAMNKGNSTEQIYQNVIQCLCRCLLRSPWSAEWPAVFSPQMIFIENPVLRPSLSKDTNYLGKLGKTLMRYKHHADARNHLLLLLDKESDNADLLAAIAKCEEKERNPRKAEYFYRQATLVKPGNKKLLWNLQQCLLLLGRHEERLNCLKKMEELFPDDGKVIYEYALCLMRLGLWQEARSRFFKLELSDRYVQQSVRAIAWCALQLGDLKLAHSYYNRILDKETNTPGWEDYLNYGHTLWLQGDIPEALEYYRQYISEYISTERNVNDPLEPFDKDKDMLLHLGIKTTDICLMRDIIVRGSDVKTDF